jgi:hypothetical protein
MTDPANAGRDLAGGAPLPYRDRPATTDWVAWQQERDQALAPLKDERARLTGEMDALQNGGDYGDEAYAKYTRLSNQRDMIDIDTRTAIPPRLSDSGTWERGDVQSFLRERAATPGDPEGYAFDDMDPDAQRAYIKANAPEYELMRQQDVMGRDGQSRLPGAEGDALGELLKQYPTLLAAGGWKRGARGARAGCTTCDPPPKASQDEVWMYRGIQVRRGEPVQGARAGQMASTSPADAVHYGLNPPGARPPDGADELVLMRFKVRPGQAYDPDPRPAPAGTSQHLILEDGVDVTKLPGYQEIRVPLRDVAGPPDAERGVRAPNDQAVRGITRRLRP